MLFSRVPCGLAGRPTAYTCSALPAAVKLPTAWAGDPTSVASPMRTKENTDTSATTSRRSTGTATTTLLRPRASARRARSAVVRVSQRDRGARGHGAGHDGGRDWARSPGLAPEATEVGCPLITPPAPHRPSTTRVLTPHRAGA